MGRDRENAAARSVDRHADQLALGGDEGAAFRRQREPQIEAQLGVDLSAVGAVPGAARERHDPERGDDVALRSPDGDGEMAGPQIRCDRRCERRRFAGKAQHGDVGRGIAPDQCRFDATSVRQGEREVGVALHCLLGGDDEAGLPDDAARGDRAAAVHGDHRAGGRLDGRCQVSRELR
jgi:hypothetical protein